MCNMNLERRKFTPTQEVPSLSVTTDPSISTDTPIELTRAQINFLNRRYGAEKIAKLQALGKETIHSLALQAKMEIGMTSEEAQAAIEHLSDSHKLSFIANFLPERQISVVHSVAKDVDAWKADAEIRSSLYWETRKQILESLLNKYYPNGEWQQEIEHVPPLASGEPDKAARAATLSELEKDVVTRAYMKMHPENPHVRALASSLEGKTKMDPNTTQTPDTNMSSKKQYARVSAEAMSAFSESIHQRIDQQIRDNQQKDMS